MPVPLLNRVRPPRAVALAVCAAIAVCALACRDGVDAGRGDVAAGHFGGVTVGAEAPEFTGLGAWLNSDALTVARLTAEDRVVLVDFWTYTCVNCLRTLPFLRDWDAKYRERGLTIVGVHAPEFEFEKDPANVARAVAAEGLLYPIAQDDDMATWRAFRNNVWPAKYLVGADGRVAYRHFGEGDYAETEQAIRAALEAAGHDVDDIEPGGVEEPVRDATRGQTRELYFGYGRGYASGGVYSGNEAYYEGPDEVRDYDDPAPPYVNHIWYAQGVWRNEREALVHARASLASEDYVALRFLGRTVNPVMHPPPDGVASVAVTLDGEPLTPEQAGPDVAIEADGRSVVRVAEPRMYRVLALPEHGEGVLRLAPDAEGFAIYAVTFGAYTEGP